VLLGGLNIEGENDAYDFGSGAGFYVDATKAPYNQGYNMYSYVTEELPEVVFKAFPQLDASRVSITGHSMGGHGALSLVSNLHCSVLVQTILSLLSSLCAMESWFLQSTN
jgi:S-formylglutathione hydrolase FrmB